MKSKLYIGCASRYLIDKVNEALTRNPRIRVDLIPPELRLSSVIESVGRLLSYLQITLVQGLFYFCEVHVTIYMASESPLVYSFRQKFI